MLKENDQQRNPAIEALMKADAPWPYLLAIMLGMIGAMLMRGGG